MSKKLDSKEFTPITWGGYPKAVLSLTVQIFILIAAVGLIGFGTNLVVDFLRNFLPELRLWHLLAGVVSMALVVAYLESSPPPNELDNLAPVPYKIRIFKSLRRLPFSSLNKSRR